LYQSEDEEEEEEEEGELFDLGGLGNNDVSSE